MRRDGWQLADSDSRDPRSSDPGVIALRLIHGYLQVQGRFSLRLHLPLTHTQRRYEVQYRRAHAMSSSGQLWQSSPDQLVSARALHPEGMR
jgi:hypothetical protein